MSIVRIQSDYLDEVSASNAIWHIKQAIKLDPSNMEVTFAKSHLLSAKVLLFTLRNLRITREFYRMLSYFGNGSIAIFVASKNGTRFRKEAKNSRKIANF
jgi:hypothetical protein